MFFVNTPNGTFMTDHEDIYITAHMSSGQVFESHIINGILIPIIKKCKYRLSCCELRKFYPRPRSMGF